MYDTSNKKRIIIKTWTKLFQQLNWKPSVNNKEII